MPWEKMQGNQKLGTSAAANSRGGHWGHWSTVLDRSLAGHPGHPQTGRVGPNGLGGNPLGLGWRYYRCSAMLATAYSVEGEKKTKAGLAG